MLSVLFSDDAVIAELFHGPTLAFKVIKIYQTFPGKVFFSPKLSKKGTCLLKVLLLKLLIFNS